MSNNDSFNDSGETFSFYSSKNVTETFKAQFKKIVANHHENKVNVNNGDELSKKTKGNADEAPVICKKDNNDNPAEDSIELITDFTPSSSKRRRSERLKRKAQTNSVTSNYLNHNLDIRCSLDNRRIPRNRRKRSRQNRQQKKVIDEVTLDDSLQEPENDELNPEVSVKVIWKSVNFKKFRIRKFQKLSCIFEQLSKEENIPEDKIILSFDNVRVSQNDTPDSLNLQVYHFLHGGELSELSNLCHTSRLQNVKPNSDLVLLKFQDANKKIIKVALNKHEKLRIGMIKCSEQLEIPYIKIKFLFEGEILEPNETPDSLGLENEEIIDFKICD